MAKLTDPHKVAKVLKDQKGNKTAAASVLGVSTTALHKYIPKHIRIECVYIVIEQPTVIDAHANKEG